MKKKIKEFFNLSKKEMINIKGGDEMESANTQYTSLSNIMKVKHDTAKNAINNVR